MRYKIKPWKTVEGTVYGINKVFGWIYDKPLTIRKVAHNIISYEILTFPSVVEAERER